MTDEFKTDPEIVIQIDEAYIATSEFLVGLTTEQQGEVYKEAMLAFVYHLSNKSPEPEVQFKILFNNAIQTGAERAGLKEKTNDC